MPNAEYAQGSVICSAGEPFRQLMIITKGNAQTSFCGQTFTLGQGDMIGLNALLEGSHSLTYTAATAVTIFTLPYEDISSLEALFREKEDIANVVVNSMVRQLATYLEHHGSLKSEAVNVYETVTSIHPQYEKMCETFGYTAKKLPMLTTVVEPTEVDELSSWVNEYYKGISELEPPVIKAFFSKFGISFGFMQFGSEELARSLSAIKHYQQYLESVSKVLLNPAGFDLLSLFTELHIEAATISGGDASVTAAITPLISTLSNMRYIEKDKLQARLATYNEHLAASRGGNKPVNTGGAEKQNLQDSVGIIIAYAGLPEDDANKFARIVQEYTKLTDRGSSEDVAHRLRRELTNMFNEIYKAVFLNSLKDPAIPTIVKMFLNFGYVDAALAGHENADYLYSIADSIGGDPARGIYTAYEWLMAVYQGKKEPCRNEFDMDYTAYVLDLKQQKRFDDKEEQRLLNDKMGKLMFEIDQIFPIVNKLTFGRITTFCPVLSDNNIQRGLEASLITPDSIFESLKEIRDIDFGAYFRETAYTNPEIGINRESVNVEILPEVILMPNVGVRGIMWQEIEGRKRTTKARMFAPLFLLIDLKPLLVRLTGEFRWEMCKRVQGSRWQDITEPSLTSEYSDYLQFYRTNRDLSAEIKADVKQQLTRARNNYKAVFVANYTDWILAEANGSPRLNKFARKLLMTYCTFAAPIRENLVQNPQYAEPLKRFNFQIQQREHHLSRVIQKLKQTGHEVPKELVAEIEFVKK
ncbi:MAG: cyclic nucleotide-binding domain-containing protein [Defluviitaleaceae bacterium]|nr:cyclic nucleotide-binding domain-containing protein [Defluviitaleaceae bacterium]